MKQLTIEKCLQLGYHMYGPSDFADLLSGAFHSYTPLSVRDILVIHSGDRLADSLMMNLFDHISDQIRDERRENEAVGR